MSSNVNWIELDVSGALALACIADALSREPIRSATACRTLVLSEAFEQICNMTWTLDRPVKNSALVSEKIFLFLSTEQAKINCK